MPVLQSPDALREMVGGHYWLSHCRGLSERKSGKVLCRLSFLTEMSLLVGLLQIGHADV